ncbi:hypothetical protein PR003_g30601 [Phytophthora rubi]|uniref:Uncharacterized protein n=1 Tax=Phytophthora rubi TaxID=129364 RepID=A0A6A3H2I2_9STRA|nr:hypothetical protein PR001_g29843 [Phytophthora rubi]KAE8963038.1 hypothetical protein PR002_g29410 [Phytophthora rubi]KAE9271121.1 hypothetical protein PR003_g30601 [Phytophthora rubi]
MGIRLWRKRVSAEREEEAARRRSFNTGDLDMQQTSGEVHEDGERYGYSDSTSDEEMEEERDDEDQGEDEENRSAQATMDDLLDYSYPYLGAWVFAFHFDIT